jgi:small subunit ribosomal protein S1
MSSETNATETETTAVATEAAAPVAPVAAEAAGEEHDDAEGDEAGEEEAAAEGAEGAAAEGAAPAKKKRRRRKKKKAAGAEGAQAEGAEGAPAAPKADPHKKVVREVKAPKAAFYRSYNVGDQVFGKITEVTPNALFIDLFDKGKAVFDLREIALLEASEAQKAENEAAIAAAEAAEGPAHTEEAAEASAPVEAAAEAAAAEGGEAPAEAEATEATEATGDVAETEGAEKAEERLMPPMPPIVLEVGANFVGIVHNDGGRGGLVVLTRFPKRGALAKPRVREALEKKTTIEGLVTGAIKGGVEVDVDGLRAFAPASTMDVRPGADMKPFVGHRLDFHVTSYGKRGRDIVLSRKDLVEAEYKKLRAERLATLVVGETVKGKVRTVVSFGAFIDLGGVEGLVPLQELSHNRSDGPSDVFTVGEDVEVKLIRVDEKGKIWLSRRALLEDPWASVAAKYAVGSKHTGKVVRIQPFGAFVELEPGIDGLIHAADLSFERFDDIHKVVKSGQTLEVVVSSLEMGQRRIALCPYNAEVEGEEAQRVIPNKSVKVKVVSHEPAGLVVRVLGVVGRGARAFITGAGTGTARGTDLKKEFPTGTVLEAKVVEVDPRRGEAKLSVKALREDAERSAYNQYRKEVNKSSKFTLGDLLAKRGS